MSHEKREWKRLNDTPSVKQQLAAPTFCTDLSSAALPVVSVEQVPVAAQLEAVVEVGDSPAARVSYAHGDAVLGRVAAADLLRSDLGKEDQT